MVEQAEHVVGESLEAFAMKHLEQGRAGWDIPHTRSVVHYARELATLVGVNVDVLEAAAYLHDTGYPPIGESEGFARVKDKKAYHMERGAELAREFLGRSENRSLYTDEERAEIIRLVGLHDRLDDVDPHDLTRIVMVEADTLGMIDYSRATPTFRREDGLRFLANVEERRVPVFQTEVGKRYLTELFPRAKEYFIALPQ